MALNREFVGRAFPPSEPYEVSRVKIREFADAIGDTNPLYRDPDAARAAGYDDVVAPPTLPTVITLGVPPLADPELGRNYALVVHGEQRSEYRRPLRAGDVVVPEPTVTGIRSIGRNERLDIRTEVRTVD